MSTNRSPANIAFVSELSLSFHDELTATIHNAFGLAVEIAVLEVTKLVRQALGDVREQLKETLNENTSLKQRLEAAESEVCALRRRVDDESKFIPAGAIPQVHLPSVRQIESVQSLDKNEKQTHQMNPDAKSKQPTDLLNAGERCGYLAHLQQNKSFCEIADGRVCSHELSSDLGGESTSRTESQNVTVSEGSFQSLFLVSQVDVVQFDHVRPETTPGADTPRTLVEKETLPDAVCPKPGAEQPVEVKEESPDLACGTGSGSFGGGEEDLDPDSLSLAQSKLLEDWRPELLHLQSCNTDQSIKTHSAVFNLEMPDILTPATSGLPLTFSKTYSPGETEGIFVSGQPLSAQTSSTNSKMPPGPHVCNVCGEGFHQDGELCKHSSQHHSPTANGTPKRQPPPPRRCPYRCSWCGRDFNRTEHLKVHQRIHTGERPYTCSVCSARFRHAGVLTRHFRIHTGEKPYVCSQCGKAFRRCGALRCHQRSHSTGGVA